MASDSAHPPQGVVGSPVRRSQRDRRSPAADAVRAAWRRWPRRRPDVTAWAERSWRPLLALAVVAFAVSGPAHALGHVDLVYHLVLGALATSAVAVPLGLWGLRHRPTAAGDGDPRAGRGAGSSGPDRAEPQRRRALADHH